MKFIFLNPHPGNDAVWIESARKRGDICIPVSTPALAAQVLRFHGRSVDFAIIRREGPGGEVDESGLEMLARLKQDPEQADLPVIVVSSSWSDTDFIEHQSRPEGAHAYLKYPFQEAQLYAVLERMFGAQLRVGAAEVLIDAGHDFLLEAVEAILPPKAQREGTSIRMEIPEFPKPQYSGGVAQPAPEVSVARKLQRVPSTGTSASVNLESEVESPKKPSASARTKAPVIAAPERPSSSESVEDDSVAAPAILQTEPLDQGTGFSELPREQSGIDQLLADSFPYLFQSGRPKSPSEVAAEIMKHASGTAYDFTQPVGDAVVPGGAHHALDIETLRKYLFLREQDVAALSTQLKAVREQMEALEATLHEEKARNAELEHTITEQAGRIAGFDRERQEEMDRLEARLQDEREENRRRAEEARVLSQRVKEAEADRIQLKRRVRDDLIRAVLREREKTNRYEILKRDFEAQLASRMNLITELKRKVDTLEFNMDLAEERLQREKENNARLKQKHAEALRALRMAGGFLQTAEAQESSETSAEESDGATSDDDSGFQVA